jgi:hypothetical protein|tara:strand:+ start:259 stop:474 length:216 start_codon:yes stop_codon:yes gene_type:complete
VHTAPSRTEVAAYHAQVAGTASHEGKSFCVHHTEVEALAEAFSPDARLLYAPRALLEVVAGGQPRPGACQK